MLKIIEKLIGEKKEYRDMMKRVESLPEEYSYTYKKMQKYMWNFASGDGMDTLKIQYDIIDLFEEGAANGKHVLEITGDDVAAFCDELLSSTKTYYKKIGDELNNDIHKKLSK